MKGARINFGVPNSEYVLLANDSGEATSLKNQDTGTEYIGGGDSDFTIANVTITTNDLDLSKVPYLTEYDGIEFIQGGIINASGDYQIPLYKGNAVFTTEEPLTVVVTGNITPIVEGQAYLITGDGTITLSD